MESRTNRADREVETANSSTHRQPNVVRPVVDSPTMSTHRFERTIGDPAPARERAQRETRARGGVFEGDHTAGHYRMKTPLGPIEGTYSAVGNTVSFVVERKPALVPLSLISRVIDEFLRD